MSAPTTARRLSGPDLELIRTAVRSGRRPKVVFTEAAGQIAGQSGHVVELTDPAASEEWIVVRFGRDELPFSPVDLALPARSAPARQAGAPVVAGAARREDAHMARTNPAAIRRPTAPHGSAPAKAAAAGAKDTVTNHAVPNGGVSNGGEPNGARADAPVARAARPAKPKVPASLVVTLAYTDREWTVAAQQGSRALAKPYVIRPGDALRMVAQLDVPAVHEAVESIIAAERAEAEARALRLRTELAEIESRLSELAHRP